MSVILTAWIVSIAGALAFVAAGFFIGRLGRRELMLDDGHQPTMRAASEVARPPIPEPAEPEREPEPEPRPAPPQAQKPATLDQERTVLIGAIDEDALEGGKDLAALAPARSGFREDNLSQLLGGLDEEGTLLAVLGDDRGLPLAVWGPDSEAAILAAIGAQVALLDHRLEDLAPGASPDRFDVRLRDGRVFQSRPLRSARQTFLVTSLGTKAPSDQRFEAVGAQLSRILTSTTDQP